MTTLTVEDAAIPIIKSSLNQHENLLELKLQSYQQQMKKFEQKHNMPSEEFINKFLAGELGDEAYLIEWEFYFDCYKKTLDRLQQIRSIML